MGFFYYYQSLNAGLRRDGRPTASNLRLSTAHTRGNDLTSLGRSKKPSGRLQDCYLIEFLDITGPPPKEPLNLFYVPAPDLCIEADAGGPSNEGDHENDDTLLSLEKLLFGAGEVPESQRAGSSIEQDGDQGGDIDGSSSVHPRSDGSTSNEQEAGCSILCEKTEDSISDPPPSLPTILPSSIHDTQICFKNTEPHHSGGGKEKGDRGASCSTDNIIPYSLRSPIAMWSPTHFTNAKPETTTGATDIRDPSKRTADTAGLNDGGGSVHRLEKARRVDPIMINETDDTDDNLSDLEFARIRSQPKPVFRRPPSPPTFQQRKKTTSSSRSSEVGDSQDNPLVVEDDEEKTGETGGSTRATSMESEIGTAHLSVALSCGRVEQTIRGGDRGAATTVYPLHAIAVAPGLPKQPEDRGASASDEEEWEIVRIVDKRWTGSCYEYKVRWEETWLLESELGNEQELLRYFEAQGRAQRRRKRSRPAGADKGR